MKNEKTREIKSLEETSKILENALFYTNKKIIVKTLNWRMENENDTSNAN
jgi:hypothetical protein